MHLAFGFRFCMVPAEYFPNESFSRRQGYSAVQSGYLSLSGFLLASHVLCALCRNGTSSWLYRGSRVTGLYQLVLFVLGLARLTRAILVIFRGWTVPLARPGVARNLGPQLAPGPPEHPSTLGTSDQGWENRTHQRVLLPTLHYYHHCLYHCFLFCPSKLFVYVSCRCLTDGSSLYAASPPQPATRSFAFTNSALAAFECRSSTSTSTASAAAAATAPDSSATSRYSASRRVPSESPDSSSLPDCEPASRALAGQPQLLQSTEPLQHT